MPVVSLPPDPLQSPLWATMAERFLAGAPIAFDDRIKVLLPPVTEDQTQIPIAVDARALGSVDEVAVIADLNPFPLTLKVMPKATPAYVALRMRIEQGTVIRAAVRKDGQWLVAGAYLDATGGGCSAPPVGEAKLDWGTIGQIRARVWREAADALRVRMRIVHPMDTGLQKTPAFYIETINVRDAAGAMLADMELHESVAMNPTFSVQTAAPKSGDHILIQARDIDGGHFSAKVPLPPQTASADHAFKEGRL